MLRWNRCPDRGASLLEYVAVLTLVAALVAGVLVAISRASENEVVPAIDAAIDRILGGDGEDIQAGGDSAGGDSEGSSDDGSSSGGDGAGDDGPSGSGDAGDGSSGDGSGGEASGDDGGGGFWGGVGDFFSSAGGGAWDAITDFGTELWDAGAGIVDGVGRFIDDPGQWASDTWDGIRETGEAFWEGITTDPIGFGRDVLFSEGTQERWANGDYVGAVSQGITENVIGLIPYVGWGKKANRVRQVADSLDGSNHRSDGLPGNRDRDGNSNDRNDDRSPNACPVGSSFLPGTTVLMADGTRTAIENVEVGDEVYAFDPLTGVEGARDVTAVLDSDGEKTLVEIEVSAADGSTDTVVATDAHPFWAPELATWVDAGDLEPGTWLRTASGTWVQVSAIESWTVPEQQVHNLGVAGLQTYYVTTHAGELLVHNQGCRNGKVTLRGNELANESYDYRAGRHPDNNTPIPPGRNVSTFEYTDANGQTQTITRANEPGGRHAEEVIMDDLREMGVPNENVSGIYSERVPCSQRGHDCGVRVGDYENADISFSLDGNTSQNASDIERYMRENGDL